MYTHYDWREKPRIISYSSVLLLLIFVGAFAFIAWAAWQRPWADDGAGVSISAREWVDRGLDPLPPPAVGAPGN
jgi:hypothetical protein